MTLLAARDLQRLRRLLAPRRPAVGHRPAHRVLDRCSSIPFVGTVARVPGLRRRVPGDDILRASSSSTSCIVPVADRRRCSACTSRSSWRQKHTQFRGRGRTRGQRRRLAAVADVHGEEHRPVRGRRRRARAARRSRADQSGVALRAVRPGGGEHRRAARLVHGLARGRAAPHAARGTSTSVRTTISELVLARRSCCPGITFALLYVWPFLERARHARPRASTTCSTGRATARCAPRSASACSTFYVVLLLAGGQDIWAQQLDVGCRRSCGRSASCCSCCRCSSAGSRWKVCRDLQAGHHSEHEADLAEPPVASNDEDGSSLAPTPEPIGAQSEMRQPPP